MKRCVCGRSQRFPLCDGSHGEGWECADQARAVGTCVVAGGHLASVAERLAHREGGVVAHRVEGEISADHLIVLTDGTDLDVLQAELVRVRARERRVIVVDAPVECVASGFAGFHVHRAAPDDPLHLWRAVLAALEGEEVRARPVPRAFLSHAVADEPVLQPVVDYLRRWAGAELFLCADSIGAGDAWRTTIDQALRDCEVFVLVGSAASFASTYCAYEVGMATALGKPCRMVILDGALPPPFIAHVQAIDLMRHRNRRPWLGDTDALIDGLLDAMGSFSAT
ncbi:MAG: TIR domain-containing protein [Myxococcota bacterium]